MIEKLQKIIDKYESLNNELMSQGSFEISKAVEINKKISNMQESYDISKDYIKMKLEIKEANDIIKNEIDEDIINMAKEQKKDAENKIIFLEERLKIVFLPKDPNDDKNIFLEIRPAAGGDEAGLFATELLRMYISFAQKKGRKNEIIEQQMSDIGGLKIAVVKISGNSIYSLMKFESGVHRVQRIPDTESQGRVHTSTVTVAIMPEVTSININIDPKDITMDTYAASSAGGQNANKNQTGVRIHHKPTGIIVNIGDSKSQLQNKERAFQILKAKLYQEQIDKQNKEQKEIRGNQIGTGDRSEKIRTYNFPQDRITDHRIKKSWSNIPLILSGEILDILDTMVMENQTKILQLQSNKDA